jgi:hypothetical protein
LEVPTPNPNTIASIITPPPLAVIVPAAVPLPVPAAVHLPVIVPAALPLPVIAPAALPLPAIVPAAIPLRLRLLGLLNLRLPAVHTILRPNIQIPPILRIGSCQWIKSSKNDPIPEDAVQGGFQNGVLLYVAREAYGGGIYPGMLSGVSRQLLYPLQAGVRIADHYEVSLDIKII